MDSVGRAKFTTVDACNCPRVEGRRLSCYRYESDLEINVDIMLGVTHLYALTAGKS